MRLGIIVGFVLFCVFVAIAFSTLNIQIGTLHVFIAQVVKQWEQGDYVGAQNASKSAKRLWNNYICYYQHFITNIIICFKQIILYIVIYNNNCYVCVYIYNNIII